MQCNILQIRLHEVGGWFRQGDGVLVKVMIMVSVVKMVMIIMMIMVRAMMMRMMVTKVMME